MAKIFAWQIELPDWLEFLGDKGASFAATLIVWLLLSLFGYLVLTYVLKWLVRRIPGKVDDIILEVVRKPLFILIVFFGLVSSLQALELSASTMSLLHRISNTVIIATAGFVIWRVLEDVIVHFGELWAQKTESRIDDVLMPVVRVFGPLIIGMSALILVLGVWGINVTSVLVGAGVLGLVLGLAMQDTLTNIFSGLSLIIDAPFRTGDLISLPDKQICRVEKIGMRATQLYYISEHSTIFMPNKNLADVMLANITRPTVDLKVTVEFGVAMGTDLNKAEKLLLDIANSHPNVLGSIETKIESLSRNLDNDPDQEKNRVIIEKLRCELELNEQITDLVKDLEHITRDIRELDRGGLNPKELRKIQSEHVEHIAPQVKSVVDLQRKWSAIFDPWAYSDEQQAFQQRWENQNVMLSNKWNNLEKKIENPGDYEMRLDELTENLQKWVRVEYKLDTSTWKGPHLAFKSFGPTSINLSLEFYVDDIRLEHNERKGRVTADMAKRIYQRFQKEGINLSFTMP
jgi:MscS family membrane protein